MDILYKHNFRDNRIVSTLLQNESILNMVKSQNKVWVRPLKRSWENTLRNPILGCILELRTFQTEHSVHIDSPKAKKLIWNICYRT